MSFSGAGAGWGVTTVGGGAGYFQAAEQTATTPNISLEDLAGVRNAGK